MKEICSHDIVPISVLCIQDKEQLKKHKPLFTFAAQLYTAMYFILSKVLLFLVFPINWIIALVLIALFNKRVQWKRKSLIAAAVLLLVFTNPYLLHLLAKNWDIGRGKLPANKVYSAAIVLGGFAGEDKNGDGVFNSFADRFIQGMQLKAEGKVSHLMISSGNGNLQQTAFKEATWAQGVLKKFNLPDTAVLIEHESRNTIENAAFSKTVLQKAHLQPPYLLVTSAWHMRRALLTFRKEGIDVVPYPSGHVSGDDKMELADYLMPDAGTLGGWNFYIKEIIGYVVTVLK